MRFQGLVLRGGQSGTSTRQSTKHLYDMLVRARVGGECNITQHGSIFTEQLFHEEHKLKRCDHTVMPVWLFSHCQLERLYLKTNSMSILEQPAKFATQIDHYFVKLQDFETPSESPEGRELIISFKRVFSSWKIQNWNFHKRFQTNLSMAWSVLSQNNLSSHQIWICKNGDCLLLLSMITCSLKLSSQYDASCRKAPWRDATSCQNLPARRYNFAWHLLLLRQVVRRRSE